MRYISVVANLKLTTYGGDVKYSFGPNGVLVIGDPTSDSGATNIINETQSSPVLATELQILDSTKSNLERFGLNRTFFKAPPLTPGTDTASALVLYDVLNGHVTYNGVTYRAGQRFRGVSGVTAVSTSDGGTFALAIPDEYRLDECDASGVQQGEFAKQWLHTGQEGTGYYDITNGQGYTSNVVGYTLQSLTVPPNQV